MSFSKIFKKTGPGLIIAATGLGAGDIVAASVAGAQYGSTLLWAVVIGAIFKFCLNEGLARWQLITGKTFLEGWIDHLPRALSGYFFIYLLLWTFMVSAALMAATGLAAHAIFPSLSVPMWGVLHSIVAVALVLKGAYQFLENLMKLFIGLMCFCIMLCALLVMPPLSEIVKGILIPSFPTGSLVYVMGIIGGVGGSVTIMSYGYWMNEAGWNKPQHLKDMRIDLSIAYGLTAIFGIAILLVSAGVDVKAVEGNNMALAVADQLQATLGVFAKWVFLIGFWGAVFSSMIGVWHGVPFLFADFYSHVNKHKKPLKEVGELNKTPAYLIYLAYLSIVPMLLLVQGRPVWIVILYSVTGAFFMPMVAILLLYMNSAKNWLGAHINSLLNKAVLACCLLLFSVLFYVKIQSYF